LRLFFALWPDPPVREQLDKAASHLPRGIGRRIPAENLHITLEFIGAVTAAARDELEAVTGGISVEPFELVLSRFGYWPRSRVVWFGPHHLPPELLALVFKLRTAAEECDLEPDTHPYRPHVSLYRKVTRQPVWPEVDPVTWTVNDFVLCQSLTADKGPRYEVLNRWPLGSGTAGR